ncbi:UDP-N-acetylmuramoyl-tripeptide--D-alanyl-D-alanine ligase [candidate division KSB1 bacterium]|nr:UDP-N-acetylmuramoyl-tripeptide--D-alanyl-D-alanine ligase [candidate division KSB1 bacterium]
MDLTLKELGSLFSCPVRNEPDRIVKGVGVDSRTLSPGQLFFALKGERADGHDFIPQAFEKGALAAVVSVLWLKKREGMDNSHPCLPVQDPLTALQTLARYYRSKFSLEVIAITGTNGKTTTKEMVAAVLSRGYRVLKTPGNYNNCLGMPLTLCRLEKDHQIGVVEIGACCPGEIEELCRIADPQYGLITNVGGAHLQFFDSIEGVARAKAELFSYLGERKGLAFVNTDDPRILKNCHYARAVFLYGLGRPGKKLPEPASGVEVKGWVAGRFLGLDERGFPSLQIDGVRIKLGILGGHNVHNALAAAAIGLHFGIHLDGIKAALEGYQPLSQRTSLGIKKGITIINDTYNANFDSTQAALQLIRAMKTGGRRIAVLGDMLELGGESLREHEKVGRLAAELDIDELVTYGPWSRFTCETAREAGLLHYHHFESKQGLIDFVKSIIKPGDLVLVKGSRGMAMEEVVEKI